jgi:hypothetical protein
MIRQLVFLLEEDSMKSFLESFMPRIVGEAVSCVYISHQGKTDLEKSIPRKIRAWQNPSAYFIILRDQDSSNCIKLKQHLQTLCGITDNVSVRIVCRELESWYLGDLAAIDHVFEKKLAKRQNQSKYRDPDKLINAYDEIKKVVPEYQRIIGSRKLGEVLSLENNRSKSFNVFLKTIRQLTSN